MNNTLKKMFGKRNSKHAPVIPISGKFTKDEAALATTFTNLAVKLVDEKVSKLPAYHKQKYEDACKKRVINELRAELKTPNMYNSIKKELYENEKLWIEVCDDIQPIIDAMFTKK